MAELKIPSTLLRRLLGIPLLPERGAVGALESREEDTTGPGRVSKAWNTARPGGDCVGQA